MNHKSAVLKDKTYPTANQPVAAVCTKTRVCFRKSAGKDQNGLQKHDRRAATCHDLVQFAKTHLQPTWSAFGISEDPILVVLEAERGTNTNVVEKQHGNPVEPDKVYTILECWTKTPVQLLRRVRLDDARNVTTYTHPDKISLSPLTKLSPLACAALRRNEFHFPWCSALPDGSINVHGISLGLDDDATRRPAAVDPFEPIPIGSNECIGITSMSLAQYDGLVPKTETHHPLRGILETSISHEGFLVRGENSQVEIPDKSKKQAGQVTKRMVNWRFALPEGLDLTEHGCSLVRLKETVAKREWIHSTQEFRCPFLLRDAVDALDGSKGFDDVLRNIAFACMSDDEPEPFLGAPAIASKEVMAFPKLAEPQPIQNLQNDPQMKLYRAVVVLYYVNSDSWIQQLIQCVEEVDYEAEKLSSAECSRLVEAIDLASIELDEQTEVANTKEKEDLVEGRDVLCELLSSSLSNEHAPPTTPAPPRQASSQGGLLTALKEQRQRMHPLRRPYRKCTWARTRTLLDLHLVIQMVQVLLLPNQGSLVCLPRLARLGHTWGKHMRILWQL